MSRAARVLDLADRLRGSAETTVDALAAELRVSARTVRRDLAVLRERGMPISGQAGPGGGVRLEGGRGVTAVHLSIAEVVSLWLAARLAQATGDVPWSRRAESALAKLHASLPRERARDLRDLCGRVFVGAPASRPVHASMSAAPAELLQLLEEAISRGVGIGFTYHDRNGRRTARRIEPHGLLVQLPVWYILARDVERGEPRMFRTDRVASPALLPALRFRPDRAIARALLPSTTSWAPLLPPPAERAARSRRHPR